jgi:hypothetical protein
MTTPHDEETKTADRLNQVPASRIPLPRPRGDTFTRASRIPLPRPRGDTFTQLELDNCTWLTKNHDVAYEECCKYTNMPDLTACQNRVTQDLAKKRELELKEAQDLSVAFEAQAREAEAKAQEAEAQAQAQAGEAEAQAQAREAEAQAQAREAEAQAREAEAQAQAREAEAQARDAEAEAEAEAGAQAPSTADAATNTSDASLVAEESVAVDACSTTLMNSYNILMKTLADRNHQGWLNFFFMVGASVQSYMSYATLVKEVINELLQRDDFDSATYRALYDSACGVIQNAPSKDGLSKVQLDADADFGKAVAYCMSRLKPNPCPPDMSVALQKARAKAARLETQEIRRKQAEERQKQAERDAECAEAKRKVKQMEADEKRKALECKKREEREVQAMKDAMIGKLADCTRDRQSAPSVPSLFLGGAPVVASSMPASSMSSTDLLKEVRDLTEQKCDVRIKEKDLERYEDELNSKLAEVRSMADKLWTSATDASIAEKDLLDSLDLLEKSVDRLEQRESVLARDEASMRERESKLQSDAKALDDKMSTFAKEQSSEIERISERRAMLDRKEADVRAMEQEIQAAAIGVARDAQLQENRLVALVNALSIGDDDDDDYDDGDDDVEECDAEKTESANRANRSDIRADFIVLGRDDASSKKLVRFLRKKKSRDDVMFIKIRGFYPTPLPQVFDRRYGEDRRVPVDALKDYLKWQ